MSPAAAGTEWYGSFWQDGIAPGQYTFASLTKAGVVTAQVDVEFNSGDGSLVGGSIRAVAPGAMGMVLSEAGGGLTGTVNHDGSLRITSDQPVIPYCAIFIPNNGYVNPMVIDFAP